MLNKFLQGAVLLEAAAVVYGFPRMAENFDASQLEAVSYTHLTLPTKRIV